MQIGTASATRTWSISVTQYECNYNNLAPDGCTQWHFGQSTGAISSYNYQSGSGYNLADQQQNICIRREKGNSKICYSTSTITDFEISGKTMPASGYTGTGCCGFGVDGKKSTSGYDCVMIPDASKTDGTILKARAFCGPIGLVTMKGTTAATVCCKFILPFY